MKKKVLFLSAVILICVVGFLINRFGPAVFLNFHQTSPAVLSENVTETDAAKNLTVYFLNVGQGDAILIRTPVGDDILIDGGPDNTVTQKLGEYLPFWDKEIELMILTHPHSDHVAGLVEVLNRYQVDKILLTSVSYSAPDYLAWLNLIAAKNIPTEVIDRPQEIEFTNDYFPDLQIQIIYPNKSFCQQTVDNLNNTSIVTKLVYASTSVILTGDLEDEESLLTQSIVQLKSDVYKAGHHGSNNANDKGFVAAVDPDYVVISVGADNSFGHPQYRALKNFERVGATIFRTDQDGDVIFVSNGARIYPLNND